MTFFECTQNVPVAVWQIRTHCCSVLWYYGHKMVTQTVGWWRRRLVQSYSLQDELFCTKQN